METIKKKDSISSLLPIVLFAFIVMIIMWYHTAKVKKLEKDIVVLKADISHICDAGMKTVEGLMNNVEGLMNNQDGLIEAFKEIQKLKQTQKEMIYH